MCGALQEPCKGLHSTRLKLPMKMAFFRDACILTPQHWWAGLVRISTVTSASTTGLKVSNNLGRSMGPMDDLGSFMLFSSCWRLCVFSKTPRDNPVCNRHEVQLNSPGIEFDPDRRAECMTNTFVPLISSLAGISLGTYELSCIRAPFAPGDWLQGLKKPCFHLARHHRCYAMLYQSLKKKNKVEFNHLKYAISKMSVSNNVSFTWHFFVKLIIIIIHSYIMYSTC